MPGRPGYESYSMSSAEAQPALADVLLSDTCVHVLRKLSTRDVGRLACAVADLHRVPAHGSDLTVYRDALEQMLAELPRQCIDAPLPAAIGERETPLQRFARLIGQRRAPHNFYHAFLEALNGKMRRMTGISNAGVCVCDVRVVDKAWALFGTRGWGVSQREELDAFIFSCTIVVQHTFRETIAGLYQGARRFRAQPRDVETARPGAHITLRHADYALDQLHGIRMCRARTDVAIAAAASACAGCFAQRPVCRQDHAEEDCTWMGRTWALQNMATAVSRRLDDLDDEDGTHLLDMEDELEHEARDNVRIKGPFPLPLDRYYDEDIRQVSYTYAADFFDDIENFPLDADALDALPNCESPTCCHCPCGCQLVMGVHMGLSGACACACTSAHPHLHVPARLPACDGCPTGLVRSLCRAVASTTAGGVSEGIRA